jgi:nicotinamide-nucleotide amidase
VDVVSKLLAVEPVVDEPAKHRWEARFKGLIQMNELQLRQLRVPRGARVHPNPAGAAPCFEIELSGVPLICLPGFPREIHGIYEGGLGARLEELRSSRRLGDVEQIARRIFRVFGRGESQISQACRGLIDDLPKTTIHYQVKFPEVLVKLVVRDRDAGVAMARLDALDRDMRSRLAPYLYSVGDENLVDRTVRRALESRTKLATAESCTGGMIGELITAMPGSSAAYLGGAIVYSNAEKVRQLGVLQATLDQHGAVSEQTVVEMARGACERFGVDLAVSVSGIAGPDGGTPDKPVGTVWVALAGGRDPRDAPAVVARRARSDPDPVVLVVARDDRRRARSRRWRGLTRAVGPGGASERAGERLFAGSRSRWRPRTRSPAPRRRWLAARAMAASKFAGSRRSAIT